MPDQGLTNIVSQRIDVLECATRSNILVRSYQVPARRSCSIARVSSACRILKYFNALHLVPIRRPLNKKSSQCSTGFSQNNFDSFHRILQRQGAEEHQQGMAGMKKLGP